MNTVLPITPQPALLIVDDEEVSVMALERALARVGVDNPVVVARDGVEALDVLQGWKADGRSHPAVVLLDLNMPRMNGLEFLASVRTDTKLAGSVVFVLTTSDAPSDISAAYRHAAAGYIVKGENGDTMDRAVRLIRDYLDLVRLPV